MNDTAFSCSHFYSHSFPSARKRSEVSNRSQESSSLRSPMVKAKACCLVSRQCVGQDYSSNPESPGSTRDSQVWPWEERSTKLRMVLCSACLRKPRVHAKSRSEHQKSTQTRRKSISEISINSEKMHTIPAKIITNLTWCRFIFSN